MMIKRPPTDTASFLARIPWNNT